MNLLRTSVVGCAALVASLAACADGTIAQPEPESATTKTTAMALQNFDFDNGDIASDYVIPTVVPVFLQNISASDASIVLYITSTTVSSWFDAIAPYSATMKGFYSRIPRRPASEGVNNRNRNIAIMYASFRTLSATNPQYVSNWRAMLTNVGLDPDDTSTNLTTPVGIGNYAGNAIVAGRKNDGMNRDGDYGGRKYNLKMYDDYTGYEPVNTAYDLVDPSRWQPKVVTKGFGLFQIQKFVTPQWGQTKAFSYDNVKQFRLPKMKSTDWKHNKAGYRAAVDELIEASANLTDSKKMLAEFFNHKFQSLGRGGDFIRRSHNMSLEQFVQYDALLQIAAHDGGVATWYNKTVYDTVRPFSAIRFLYGKKKLRAWGGVGKGTVNDITGNEWESYLPVADHPDYPSGSSCFCSAHAQSSRRFLGSDTFGWVVPKAKGSSVIEPGITPAADLNLEFPTFTSWEEQCATSRVDAGVHFREAVEASTEMCRDIGDLAYEFVKSHIDGTCD